MTNQEAIEWQKAFKERYYITCDAAEACDMAIEALTKRPLHIKMISDYYERIHLTQLQLLKLILKLHNLQEQNDRLKAELKALKHSMKNEHDQNAICKVNGLTCIDCQPCCESRERIGDTMIDERVLLNEVENNYCKPCKEVKDDCNGLHCMVCIVYAMIDMIERQTKVGDYGKEGEDNEIDRR